MTFLDRAEDKAVTDENDIIDLRKDGPDFVFTMPAASAKGGKYFTDDTVRKIYDRWQKRGGDMTATVDQATARKLVAAMQKLGARFVAPSEPDLAYEIVFGKKQQGLGEQAARFKLRTQTPEFKRWFGDSKWSTGYGDPLVVPMGRSRTLSVRHGRAARQPATVARRGSSCRRSGGRVQLRRHLQRYRETRSGNPAKAEGGAMTP